MHDVATNTSSEQLYGLVVYVLAGPPTDSGVQTLVKQTPENRSARGALAFEESIPGMDKVRKKLLGSKKYKVKVWWNLLSSKSKRKVKYWYFYFQKYKVKSKSSETIPNSQKGLIFLSFHEFFDRMKNYLISKKILRPLFFKFDLLHLEKCSF